MSKLKDDPKVQELIAKAEAAARKAALKDVTNVIKDVATGVTEGDDLDKSSKAAALNAIKAIKAELKQLA